MKKVAVLGVELSDDDKIKLERASGGGADLS
jgi:hypothetical protein